MKLKKCPFCGGEAEIINTMGEYWCMCDQCGANSKMTASKKETKRLWNKRYTPKKKGE